MASSAALIIVRALLESGELSAAQLAELLKPNQLREVPTHFRFLEMVELEVPPSSASTYRTGFRRLVAAYGDRPLDEVSSGDLSLLASKVLAEVRAKGNVDGSGAVRNLVHSARFFYKIAIVHGHLRENPALGMALPGKRRRARRALSVNELADVYAVVTATGDDPVLDSLLLDFHRETAARRGGACSLRLCDLQPDRPSVLLREKNGNEREIPASPDLLNRIRVLASERDRGHDEVAAFRYKNGAPLTRRRYNTLFERVQRLLPWADRLGVSVHWVRHTTLTDISNAAGSRIASAYAGHSDRSVTDLYTVPSFEDLVIAHDLVFPDFPCNRG